MAYTIKIHTSDEVFVGKVKLLLEKTLEKDGRFRCRVENSGFIYKGPREGSRKEGYGFTLRNVRLTKKKEYCGNHPGVCVVNPYLGSKKKPVASYLEWDDWVAFHSIVNDVLDKIKVDADVWSNPQDVKGKMWMRKGLARRTKYEWEERNTNHWQPLRIWNQGTVDQFSP